MGGVTISQLSAVTALSTSDQIVVWSGANGDTRKASLTTLLDFFEANFANPEFETFTVAPSNDGFTVNVAAALGDAWYIVNQTSTFANGSILLPPVADAVDGQVIIFSVAEPITTLTVNGNGASTAGMPTSIGSEGFFAIRYNALATKWYCIGQSLGSTTSFADITVTGSVLSGDGETMLSFRQEGVGTAVNNVQTVYGIATQEVGFEAVGSDANIEFRITAKGAGDVSINADSGDVSLVSAGGVVRANTLEVATTTGIQQLLDKTVVDGDLQNCTVSDGVLTWATTTVAFIGSAVPAGQRKFVTDANATTFASVVAGGGANGVPVYSDGTNWRIG